MARTLNNRTERGRRFRTVSVLLAGVVGLAGIAGAVLAQPANEPTPHVAEVSATLEGGDGIQYHVSALVDTHEADPDTVLEELAPSAERVQDGGASAAYVFWKGMRWPDDAVPVVLGYNPENALDGIDAPPLITAAMEEWNSAGGHTFAMYYSGLTEARPFRCRSGPPSDGISTIAWRTDLPTGTLATTCATTHDGVVVEMDVVFSTKAAWVATEETPDDKFDFRSTLLHELGHVAGLDHTNEDGAVMLAVLTKGVQRRSLTEDDIAGIRALYPEGQAGETPTATPTGPTPTPIPGNELPHRSSIIYVGRD